MNEYGSSYVPVAANRVKTMNEGPSEPDSGWEMENSYVNWSTDGGVTGKGWDALIDASHSPFFGMTPGEIQQAIENSVDHNLNSYFSQIGNLPLAQQDEFMNDLKSAYGYTDNDGCIGVKLY